MDPPPRTEGDDDDARWRCPLVRSEGRFAVYDLEAGQRRELGAAEWFAWASASP